MQFHRPISPLSLEVVHSPPSTDLGIDGVLGSDDELDDVARVAKRRRVEKLAGAYLQGSPLFILSASLNGPFDEKWMNPWKKNRGRNGATDYQLKERRRETLHTGTESSKTAVIQETDPRRRRRYDDSVENNNRLESRNGGLQTVPLGSDAVTGHRNSHGHGHGKSGQSRSRADFNPSECRRLSKDGEHCRSEKSKKLIHRDKRFGSRCYTPVAQEEHSNWLKKARSRKGILDLEPPSSPSAAVPTRQLDIKSRPRLDVSSAMEPFSTLRRSSQYSLSTDENRAFRSPVDKKRRARSSGSTSTNESPPASKSELPAEPQLLLHSHPLVKQSSTSIAEPSHYVASSSSHLPRFEYRRPKSRVHASASPLTANQEVEENVSKQDTVEDLRDPDPSVSANSKEPSIHSTECNYKQTDQGSMHLHSNSNVLQGPIPKENRSVSFLGESKPLNHSTSGLLPSGQKTPGNVNLADFVASLHSTEVPKDDSGCNEADTNPDAQFSTQAAVLLAQKSFQNDLESPQRKSAFAFDKKRPPSQPPPSNLSHSEAITPFSRFDTFGQVIDDDRSKEPTGNDSRVISTQHMIAAVTPFTFSTEKKPNRHSEALPNSTEYRSKKKRKKTSSRVTSSSSPSGNNLPPSPKECERLEASTNITDVYPKPFEREELPSARMPPNQAYHANNDEDGSQLTALPLTLTGSTPPTAQADQGGIGSFNLREAITDAGSWLQQSFDFSRDLGACSDRSGPSSSVAARHSALNLDLDPAS